MNDITIFKNKVRVRVCGLMQEENQLLLIRHQSIGTAGFLWAPPGGGIEFGISAEETLKKEFLEETHLTIEVEQFLFVHEHIDEKHHAIELFYRVKRTGGRLKLGKDPELSEDNQILSDLRFFKLTDIDQMEKTVLHNVFCQVNHAKNVFDLKGFI